MLHHGRRRAARDPPTRGTLLLSWLVGHSVHYAIREADGSFDHAGEITSEFPPLSLAVAIDGHRRITLAWRVWRGDAFVVKAVRVSHSGEPGPVWTLSSSRQTPTDVRLALDDADTVHIAWTAHVPKHKHHGERLQTFARSVGPGGKLSPTRTLFQHRGGEYSLVAVAGDRLLAERQRTRGPLLALELGRFGRRNQFVSEGRLRTIAATGEFGGTYAITPGHRAYLALGSWRGLECVKLSRRDRVRRDTIVSRRGKLARGAAITIGPHEQPTIAWRQVGRHSDRIVHAATTTRKCRPLSTTRLGHTGDQIQVTAGPSTAPEVVWHELGGNSFAGDYIAGASG